MRLLLLLLLITTFSRPAFAYIDPGTGSLLLQGLLAVVVGALATVKLYWKAISNTVARLFGKRPHSDRE